MHLKWWSLMSGFPRVFLESCAARTEDPTPHNSSIAGPALFAGCYIKPHKAQIVEACNLKLSPPQETMLAWCERPLGFVT